jgi:hypothetical protein
MLPLGVNARAQSRTRESLHEHLALPARLHATTGAVTNGEGTIRSEWRLSCALPIRDAYYSGRLLPAAACRTSGSVRRHEPGRAGQVRLGPDASAGSPRPSQARRRASDPDLLVVDAMVGVSSDDPHALDLSRHGISGVASVTSSGSFAAMSPSRPMTASPARRSGRSPSQRSLPSITSSAAASAASARSARRSLIPLVKGLRPRRGCGRPKA